MSDLAGDLADLNLDEDGAEKSLVADVLRNADAWPLVADSVCAGDFRSAALGDIWRCFVALSAEGKAFDAAAVFETASRLKMVDVTPALLVDLWSRGGSHAGYVEATAQEVRDAASLRLLRDACRSIFAEAKAAGVKAAEALRYAEDRIYAISQRVSAGKILTVSDVIEATLDRIDRRCGGPDGEVRETAMPTGFAALDNTLGGGWHPGELVVIAARPSVGKTLFLVQQIIAACRAGYAGFFASMEQSAPDILTRAICNLGPIHASRMRHGSLNAAERDKVVQAAAEMRAWQLWFNDAPRQKASEIAGAAKRIKLRGKLDFVAVDYLQYMVPENQHGKRYEQIGEMTRRLKALARELEVPVLCLCQFGRSAEQSSDQRPKLSHLRESGDIEQDADTVIGLHKPESPDSLRQVDTLELEILKQRNGPLGTETVYHHKPFFAIKETP